MARRVGEIVDVDGHLFVITDAADLIQAHIVSGRLWESRLVDKLGDVAALVRARSGGIAHLVNVGAHIGTLSVPLCRAYTSVVAFEPVRETFDHLVLNARLNACDNMIMYNLALSDKAQSAGVVFDASNTGGTHVVTDADVQHDRRRARDREVGENARSVRCVDLDSIVLPHVPDVVVVDVEGHESEFLDGARRTLARHKPILVMEVWTDAKRRFENMHTTEADVVDKVLAFGYANCTRFSEDTLIFS